MPKLLDNINFPRDLRKLSVDQLPELAKEVRDFIIDIVSTKEGHLGASLGVVELTIALHYIYNTPEDQLVWDVGHQAYGHKILTGRKDIFDTNRQYGGISGFPKRSESIYDAFGVGHSSTAISAVLGMAMASQLSGNSNRQHIAVVGDASIASGMAFEGLNHAGVTNANLLVILNDNAIGIDPSVGALKNYLLRASIGERPNEDNIFEALNFKYFGPIDGHNVSALCTTLEELKYVEGPKFLHVITTKGKGLKKAEEDQVKYHAPGKFDKVSGDILAVDNSNKPPKYQDVFGYTMVELAKQNQKLIGITPAMPTGSSLKFMMETYPDRAFDVGIAEQHAVTFAAGMVTQGYNVFCNIYSTFLQRAYDQVIHDVCLQNLPVVFCLDRAGLVGQDGATHHGVFDLAYLRCIPNLIIAAPRNEVDLRNLMYTASLGLENPIAIRYPRGRGELRDWQMPFEKIEIGKSQVLREGKRIAVLSIGALASQVTSAINQLNNNRQKQVGHIDLKYIKPLDTNLLDEVFNVYSTIITVEDGAINGGAGSAILEYAMEKTYKGQIKRLGIPDYFVDHGPTNTLHDEVGISSFQILSTIESYL